MKLHVMKETDVRVPRQQLNAVTKLIAGKEGKRAFDTDLELIFVTDKTMKRINGKFRKTPSTTDVLSFPLHTPLKQGALLGEIYISVPKATRQAQEYGVSLGNEIVRLFCHGLLHLYGYDHHAPDEARLMRKREAQLLETVSPGVWQW